MTSSKAPVEVRVAVTQAEPVWLDLDGTVLKTIKLIKEASAQGAQLITFPECWIPGYPAWIWSRPIDFPLQTAYAKNSLSTTSPQMQRLCASASENNISILLSFSENANNTLYISQCLISSSGTLSMSRRKIKPTHMERTLFGDASGNSLQNVVDVPDIGRIGVLLGWEHGMPLLKYHTCLQNPDIHMSCWPPVYSHRGNQDLFSMSLEGCRNLSQTFAIESQSFVLHTTFVITQRGIEKMGLGEGMLGGGGSAIYGPDGRKLSEDIPEGMEGILYADLEMDERLRARAFLDVCGHGSRPDMLWLGVDDKEKRSLRYGVDGQDGGKREEKSCEKTVFSWMN